jgi:hypothetical protein
MYFLPHDTFAPKCETNELINPCLLASSRSRPPPLAGLQVTAFVVGGEGGTTVKYRTAIIGCPGLILRAAAPSYGDVSSFR